MKLFNKHPLFFKFGLIFLLLVCDLFLSEKDLFQCDDSRGIFLIILHHLITWLTLLTPFLFGFYRIHLCFILLLMFLWISNGNCILTIAHNKLCRIDDKYDNNFGIHLFRYIQIDPFFFPITVQIFYIIYDSYMIFKGY
jgi:hypothetical protein